jgi:dihydroorotase
MLLNGIIDLNMLPKDGKVSAQSLTGLSKRASDSGVVGYMLSQLQPHIDSESKLTLLESISSKMDETELFIAISGVDSNGNLSEIASLIDKAQAIYIESDIDRNVMRRVFEYAQMKNRSVICKVRDRDIDSDGVVYDTEQSFHLGLPTRHQLSERIGSAIVIEMAKLFSVPTLIQGVTDRDALESIREAKAVGVPLYIEVSIHHLIFDDSIYSDFNNYSKIDPPFQSEDGKEYLLQLLKEGNIDMLTSLHHKISESDKSGSFKESKYGVLGVDAIYSLYYTELVQKGLIDIEQLQDITSRNQMKFLGIDEVQKVEFDRDRTTKIEDIRSLYYNRELNGQILKSNS